MSVELKSVSAADFAHIYADMLSQFPPEEMKPDTLFLSLIESDFYDMYLVLDGSAKVGYASCARDSGSNIVLLDHLAVFKNMHSGGYGSQILENLREKYAGFSAMLLEIEPAAEDDVNTLRRIKFYERAGAEKLSFPTQIPHLCGILELDLYFLRLNCPKSENLEGAARGAIRNLYPEIYAHSEFVARALEHI